MPEEICEKCGKPVPVGGWPWCESKRNPLGHSRDVSYGFTWGRGVHEGRKAAFFERQAEAPFGGLDEYA